MKEEKDPNGVAPNQPGAKLDHGKLRAGLVIKGFQNALNAVAEVGTFGANKYTDDGWKSVPDGLKRYEDALYRHLLADGVDEQSGLPHLAHAAWNILAMLELQATTPKGLVEDGYIDRMKRNNDRIRDIVAGTRFTEEELSEIEKIKEINGNRFTDRQLHDILESEIRRWVPKSYGAVKKAELANPECRLFSFSDPEHAENVLLATWQFSREMWEFAYCNPKNSRLFLQVLDMWRNRKKSPGVNYCLLDKDQFNKSDLVVDGIHIPSLPKEFMHDAIMRMHPYCSSEFKMLAAAGLAFITAEENK